MEAVRTKYQLLQPLMTERLRRQWAACEAQTLGRGGVTLVAQATGLSRNTIWAGRKELQRRARRPQDDWSPERVRAPGGGRHLVEDGDPTLRDALLALVEASTRGDPQSPLCWTSRSTRKLAEELAAVGHAISHIAHQVRGFQAEGQPVISVDAKKKELIGDFRNPGRAWHRRGHPEEVRAKDFKDKQLGKAIPEGVYDLSRNEGWVSVGVDHDTAEFAVASIRRWWEEMGSAVYPGARKLLITADAGGSNGYRTRLWKVELQGRAYASDFSGI
jgi:hypothetical protein